MGRGVCGVGGGGGNGEVRAEGGLVTSWLEREEGGVGADVVVRSSFVRAEVSCGSMDGWREGLEGLTSGVEGVESLSESGGER